jgi:hypothetical protein
METIAIKMAVDFSIVVFFTTGRPLPATLPEKSINFPAQKHLIYFVSKAICDIIRLRYHILA